MSKSRTVLITGVSRGLGLAMARKFAAMGHVVVGCGRSKQAIADLRKELGTPHQVSVVDVTRDAQVAKWAAQVVMDIGVPDLILNNAGLMNPVSPLWEIAWKDFDEVIDVNIKGVANVIRHFVPAMVKRKSGIIVNFSSGWGRGTDAGVAPYCASKWAIEGLTRSLAQDLPRGMAAIPLNPGIIDTDMLRSCFGKGADQYPTAEEWAEAAVPFLLGLKASDNGRPLTVPGA
jgi:NAD(P)-dependent dehydrogenase (short-subunit alcohol dehydrogenase family)